MKILIIIVFIIFSHLSANSQQWSIADSAFGIIESPYRDIDCADSNNCIAVTLYNLDRVMDRITTDGGKSWFTTLPDSLTVWEDSRSLWHYADYVSYPDTNLCMITCKNTYYLLTRNKGKDWSLHYIDTNDYVYTKPAFFSAKIGIIVGRDNIYLTSDSARKWNRYNRKENNFRGQTMFFPDSNDYNIIYSCSGSSFYRTSNFGVTWDSFPVPCYFPNIYFFNKMEGFGVGKSLQITNIYKDMLYYTSNGGETWEKRIDGIVQYPSNAAGLRRIKFYDRENGIALGDGFKMYRTIDGGLTWLQDLSNWNSRNDFDEPMLSISVFSFRTRDEILGTNFTQNKIYRMKLLYTDIKEQQYENNEFYLYPNPSNDNIRIDFYSNNFYLTNIIIYNLLGIKQKEIQYELSLGENSISIDVSNLSSGVYFVVVNNGKEVRKQMFIKE